jgi:hypothetical protein
MGYDVGMMILYRLLRLRVLFGIARWLYDAYRRRKARRAAALPGAVRTDQTSSGGEPYPPTEP